MTDRAAQHLKRYWIGQIGSFFRGSGQGTHDAGILIPASSIASQSLVTVVAIMTFLAVLTTGGAILIRNASTAWSNQITEEMTVQIKPQAGRNIESDLVAVAGLVRSFPGVSDAKVFTKEDSARLLEPWLGTLQSIDDLPIPRLIVVRPASTGFDPVKLKQQLREKMPFAVLDDHRIWYERLNSMAKTFVFISILVLLLIVSVMALAIGFATRGAMAGTRDIIDVLHFVGAQNRFISREFQRHFFQLGLKGAVIGGTAALLFFVVVGGSMNSLSAGPQAEQIEALFGDFNLGAAGYLLVAAIIVLTPIFVAQISKSIVLNHLKAIR